MVETSYDCRAARRKERDEETRTGDLRIIPIRAGGTMVLKGKRYYYYRDDAYTVHLNFFGEN